MSSNAVFQAPKAFCPHIACHQVRPLFDMTVGLNKGSYYSKVFQSLLPVLFFINISLVFFTLH